MKVLLTGGGGFIGKNVIEQLSDRYEILAPTHTDLELTEPHSVAAWFRRHPVDAVIHMAVRPGHRNAADPSRQVQINLGMYRNLLACHDSWDRMLYVSSGAVYGTQRDLERVTEADEGRTIPTDAHGFSRYLLSGMAQQDPGVVELRPFGVFGKYEDYAIRFVSNAICKTMFDLPVTLRQDRRFSYLWVDDFMPVLVHFLEAPTVSGAFNVTPDTTDSLRDLAQLVIDLSGKDLPLHVAHEGVGLEYTGDNAGLRAEIPQLRFTPTVEAVERLYRWYTAHKDDIIYERLLVDK